MYTPISDLLAIKSVASKPKVFKEGWVKAILHWEKKILRALYDAWTQLPAICLVNALQAANHYAFALQRRSFDGFVLYRKYKITARAQIHEAVTHWWIKFSRSHIRAWYNATFRPLSAAMTERVEACFDGCLFLLAAKPLYLLCWCSQLHIGYRSSRPILTKDKNLIPRIMTKFFKTASHAGECIVFIFTIFFAMAPDEIAAKTTEPCSIVEAACCIQKAPSQFRNSTIRQESATIQAAPATSTKPS